MSNTSELHDVLYEVWSREFRTGVITEQMSSQCISNLCCRLHGAMTEEMHRIMRVVDIVPTDMEIVLGSRTCLHALRRAGIFTEEE
jgi:hypothetical protein